MTILILDGDSNAARAVLQSLGRKGYRCCLGAPRIRSSAFASRYVAQKVVYPDPLEDKLRFQSWLCRFQHRRGFELIIPATESTLIPLHELREESGLGSVLAIPPAGAVEGAFDKEKLRRVAVSVGIPTPASRFVSEQEWPDTSGVEQWVARYPVVVKPTRSKVWTGQVGSALHTRLAMSPDELRQHLSYLLALTTVQVQEWVPGRGIGVEVLAADGRVVMAFGHERLHEYPLTGGGSTYRRAMEPPPRLLEATTALMEALRWHGVAMVEFRVDASSQREWLMEVNGRFWGSLPLAVGCGADFPGALVDLLVHRRTPGKAAPWRGRYARNFAGDLQWTKEILKNRSGGPHLLTRPLLRSLLEWFRPLSGREIWDGASLRDPMPILHEVLQSTWSEIRGFAGRLRRRRLRDSVRRQTQSRLATLAASSRHILVLCYGNICRSPYAAARLRALEESGDLLIRSTGFHPEAGRPTPENVRRIAAARGIDLASHLSLTLDQESLDWADMILVMDRATQRRLRDRDRRAGEKVIWFGALDSDSDVEIKDPYCLPADEVAAILQKIDRCAEALTATIQSARSTQESQAW
ncbi:MAG: ATP-grasp domain-containing protein [Candidatus Krumholzibacteriia bacterium]